MLLLSPPLNLVIRFTSWADRPRVTRHSLTERSCRQYVDAGTLAQAQACVGLLRNEPCGRERGPVRAQGGWQREVGVGSATETGIPNPPTQAMRWAASATLGFCALCMIVLAVWRGGWLDEYWTIWHSDPRLNLVEAYWTRWVRDVSHPPLFYFLSWLFAPLTGESLAARRLVNLDALLLIGPTAWLCLRDKVGRLQQMLFALAMASSPYSIDYFAEHRSYFLGLAAAACMTVTIRQVHVETYGSRSAPRPALAIWLVVIALVTVNLHYTLALIVLTLLGCAFLYQWSRGNRETANWMAAAAALAVIPLLIFAWLAFRAQSLPLATKVGFFKGWFNIALVVGVAAATNLGLLARAASVAAAMAKRTDYSAVYGARLSFIAILAIALILLLIAFAGLQVVSSNIIPRLVLGLVPLVIAAVAELAALRPVGRGLFLLVCGNAALVAGATAVYKGNNPRWEYNVPPMRQALRECPTTDLVALNPMYFMPRSHWLWSMSGQADAWALGYKLVARENDLPITMLPNQTPYPVRSGRCPTLVWLEHYVVPLTPETLAKAGNIPRSTIGRMSSEIYQNHMLIILYPR